MLKLSPKIFQDPKYIYCLSLANLSKGNERYGSIIVRKKKVIGQGFNRAIAHSAFYLQRPIRQGMANHAEIEALNEALLNLRDTSEGDLYVAGYFPDTTKLFFHESFTCPRCIPYLREAGIQNIFVPMVDGWVKRPLNEACEESRKFVNGAHKKRADSIIGNYKINLIEGRLVSQKDLSFGSISFN